MNHPFKKELVLVGGGHSHAIFIKMWGMEPVDGVRLTLISENTDTPYSGMLPGFIAGDYNYEDTHIDLRQLCEFAGVRFICAAVTGVDSQQNLVTLDNRPPVHYDCLSLNLGSQPNFSALEGAETFGIGIKPVSSFLEFWGEFKSDYLNRKEQQVTIIGGGAAGVETALCMKKALPGIKLRLIQSSQGILPRHNAKVRLIMSNKLRLAGVELLEGERVAKLGEDYLQLESGNKLSSNINIFTTHAKAPDWLAASGLELDKEGFILVNDCLQSTSTNDVFAVGDVATMANFSRPKSGVFAVRQGKPLFENVKRFIVGQETQKFKPQKRFLSLLNSGDGAVLSRGPFTLSNQLMAKYKNYIDRSFMDRFQNLSLREMRSDIGIVERSDDQEEAMRCHGCAAKVGSKTLHKALSRLGTEKWLENSESRIIHDDAAIINIPKDKTLLQTVDHISAFVSDPYVFGRVAANHCLSDIFAMGAQPHSALANIIVPYANEKIMEEDIYQTLEGVLFSLKKNHTDLVGGHTSEGQQLSLGLTINGLLGEQALTKRGLNIGDKLILTKSLGTGLLMAASMRIKTSGRWVDQALQSMLMDNHLASKAFRRAEASACTDVTGFGLLGHLIEMLQGSPMGAKLELDQVPMFDGVRAVIDEGINSSLYAQNKGFFDNAFLETNSELARVLVDPQTSGGLLAAVPESKVDDCLMELRDLGYSSSSVIGEVIEASDHRRISVS